MSEAQMETQPVVYNKEQDAFFEGERQLTPREVDALSADTYAQALKLQKWDEGRATEAKNEEFNRQLRAPEPSDEPVVVPEVVLEVPEVPVSVEPVAEVVPVETPAPVVEEFVYEYQPVDEHNRALGNRQVFKGKDQAEVLEKVAKSNQELIKLSRELKRKNRLGLLDEENIPENIARNTTSEEDAKLSVEDRIAKLEDENAILKARAEAELFVRSHPDYYVCQENFETLTNWMVKNNLAPVHENFEFGFKQLTEVGLLLPAPTVREAIKPVIQTPVAPAIPVNTQPELVQASRITETVQAQQPRTVRPASGLTKDVVSTPPVQSVVSSVDQIVYTVPAIYKVYKDGSRVVVKEAVTYKGEAAINNMPSEEYARRFKDPAFKKAVDTYYDDKAAKAKAKQFGY